MHQIAFAEHRFGIGQHITRARWEEFDAGGRRWDTILFQESAQYIAPEAIFSQARGMLAPDGCVLILDEVALQPAAPGEHGLPQLARVLQAAQSHRFRIAEQLNLSKQAAPTVDHILRMCAQLRDGMKVELGVSDEQLDALDRSNEDYRAKYADGRYGYALLRFTAA